MSKHMIWLTLVVSLVAISLFLKWTNKLDERRQEAYTAYEECVEREYGRLPVHIYLETGEYPTCE